MNAGHDAGRHLFHSLRPQVENHLMSLVGIARPRVLVVLSAAVSIGAETVHPICTRQPLGERRRQKCADDFAGHDGSERHQFRNEILSSYDLGAASREGRRAGKNLAGYGGGNDPVKPLES